MKEVKLNSWDLFEEKIKSIAPLTSVVVRNFSRITFDDFENNPVEVDRVNIARTTGTDRCSRSELWNVEGFDFEHDKHSSNKLPEEIIYGSLIDLNKTPYLVSLPNGDGGASWEEMDLTSTLSEHDAIIIYDANKLIRKAPNEYWFTDSPLDAALLIFTVKE